MGFLWHFTSLRGADVSFDEGFSQIMSMLRRFFDSVHRKALYGILWFRGIFARIIDMMTGLYSQAESTLSLGEPFPASLLIQK